MNVVSEGRFKFIKASEFIDSSDIAQLSDTLLLLATKADLISAGITPGFADTIIALRNDININEGNILRLDDSIGVHRIDIDAVGDSITVHRTDINAIEASANTQTLSQPNDSLSITGGNTVRRDLVAFDSTSHITGSFPIGTRIKIRSTGAEYLVESSEPPGYSADGIAVIDLTGSYAVLQPVNGQYDVVWLGALPGGVLADTATNSIALQRALDYARGDCIFIPSGEYYFSRTLIPDRTNGVCINGSTSRRSTSDKGTYLKYTGINNAIDFSQAGSESLLNKFYLNDFRLVGTDSASNGVYLNISGGSILGGQINNVSIDSFQNISSYGLNLNRIYQLTISNSRIISNTSGIYIGNEAISNRIENCWISPLDSFGVHVDYGGTNSVHGGIIDNSSIQPTGQLGIYIERGNLNINGVLFEDLDRSFKIDSGAVGVVIENIVNNSTTLPSVIEDGAQVKIENVRINQDIEAGLGTRWSGVHGLSSGEVVNPTISSDAWLGFSTIMEVDGSGGAFTLSEATTTGVRDNEIMSFVFLDDSINILDENNGNVHFVLESNIPFKAYTGDIITFSAEYQGDGTTDLKELTRWRANSSIEIAGDFSIPAGGHGLVYTNEGSLDTTDFTLPAIATDGIEFTFSSRSPNPIRLITLGSNRFRGYSETVDFFVNPGSLIKIKSSRAESGIAYWEVLSTRGNVLNSVTGVNILGELVDEFIVGTTDYGNFKIQSSAGIYSNTGYKMPNGTWLSSYKTDGTSNFNLMRAGLTNNIEIGQADMEDVVITAGAFAHPGDSGDDIILKPANSESVRFKGTGETWFGYTTDQGDYRIQVNGNSYLNGTVTLPNTAEEIGDSVLMKNTSDEIVAAEISDILPSHLLTSGVTNDSIEVYSPAGAANLIVAGTGITDITKTYSKIQGSGGAVDITADPQMVDGADGQIVYLKGDSDTNTVTIDDGAGFQLAGAASFVMGKGDILTVIYDSTDDLWIEISRSDN